MRAWRIAAGTLILVTLIPVQLAIINRIPLPGTGPDLLVIVVAAVALVRGPNTGLVFGFSTGLLLDVAPPADHALGRLAIAYALAGFVAGLLAVDADRSTLGAMIVVALAAIVVLGTFIILGALLGDVRITWLAIAHGVPSTVLYDLVLSPFIVPLVGGVVRRLDIEQPSRRMP
jgi:rod shape-determining protein MreD